MNHQEILFGFEGQERLWATSPDEVIEDFLNNTLCPNEVPPATLTVVGYAPVKLKMLNRDFVLETIMERLDDHYGDPEEPWPIDRATSEMCEAADKLVNAIQNGYPVFLYTEVSREVIDITKWIADNKYDL